ncbi:hypothetical protein NEPAR04_1559 [Nematocida parisii]|nr:hypothetical protein NEPAR08_1802 [Nematocida parisii]KAI5142636.1 hypothetical protein NEPAR04_1559 [Nematocida parisii]
MQIIQDIYVIPLQIIFQLAFLSYIVQGIFQEHEFRQFESNLEYNNGAVLRINPEGALNLLRGHIFKLRGFMHNKRSMDFHVYIRYTLNAIENKKEFICSSTILSFHRFEFGDSFCMEEKKYISRNPQNDHSKSYFTSLIRMFSSILYDNASIKTKGPDISFTGFLQEKTVEPFSYDILASLLLLSEGMPLPICIEGDPSSKNQKRIVLKKKNMQDEYFSVSLDISGSNGENLSNAYYTIISDVFDVFTTKCKKNNCAYHASLDSLINSMRSFEEGVFLDNVGFLIQSYLYEYLSADTAIRFFNAVYNIISEYLPEKGISILSIQETVYKRIFERLFISKECASDTSSFSYSKLFENINLTSSNYNSHIPYTIENETEINIYNGHSPVIYWKSHFKKLCPFSNINAISYNLLSLFCFLMYDPDKDVYTTNHIASKTSDIFNFFSNNYMPEYLSELETKNEWMQIISNVFNEWSTLSCIQPPLNILNILYIISILTENYSSERHILDNFMHDLHNPLISAKDIYTRIEKYTAKKIISLCPPWNKVNVRIEWMEKCKETNDKFNLFGSIYIECVKGNDSANTGIKDKKSSYSINTQTETNSVWIYTMPLYNQPEKNLCISTFLNLKIQCIANNDSFIKYLLLYYLDVEVRKLYEINTVNSLAKHEINKFMQKKVLHLNRLFLLDKIHDNAYKCNLITYIFMHCIDSKIPRTHIIFRFVLNILGSCSKEKLNIVHKMLAGLIFYDGVNIFSRHNNKTLLSMYIPEHKNTPFKNTAFNVLSNESLRASILNYAMSRSPKTLLHCFKVIACAYSDSKVPFNVYKLFHKKEVFDFLTPGGTTEYIKLFRTISKSLNSKETAALNRTYFHWFILACEMNTQANNLIIITYKFIKGLNKHDFLEKEHSERYKKALTVLSKIKNNNKITKSSGSHKTPVNTSKKSNFVYYSIE